MYGVNYTVPHFENISLVNSQQSSIQVSSKVYFPYKEKRLLSSVYLLQSRAMKLTLITKLTVLLVHDSPESLTYIDAMPCQKVKRSNSIVIINT